MLFCNSICEYIKPFGCKGTQNILYAQIFNVFCYTLYKKNAHACAYAFFLLEKFSLEFVTNCKSEFPIEEVTRIYFRISEAHTVTRTEVKGEYQRYSLDVIGNTADGVDAELTTGSFSHVGIAEAHPATTVEAKVDVSSCSDAFLVGEVGICPRVPCNRS